MVSSAAGGGVSFSKRSSRAHATTERAQRARQRDSKRVSPREFASLRAGRRSRALRHLRPSRQRRRCRRTTAVKHTSNPKCRQAHVGRSHQSHARNTPATRSRSRAPRQVVRVLVHCLVPPGPSSSPSCATHQPAVTNRTSPVQPPAGWDWVTFRKHLLGDGVAPPRGTPIDRHGLSALGATTQSTVVQRPLESMTTHRVEPSSIQSSGVTLTCFLAFSVRPS